MKSGTIQRSACSFFNGLVPVVVVLLMAACGSRAADWQDYEREETVGRLGANPANTPVNQWLTPAGLQVELPELRPQALALSPDGRLLVTAGKTQELVVVQPKQGAVLQRVRLPSSNLHLAACRT